MSCEDFEFIFFNLLSICCNNFLFLFFTFKLIFVNVPLFKTSHLLWTLIYTLICNKYINKLSGKTYMQTHLMKEGKEKKVMQHLCVKRLVASCLIKEVGKKKLYNISRAVQRVNWPDQTYRIRQLEAQQASLNSMVGRFWSCVVENQNFGSGDELRNFRPIETKPTAHKI